MFLNKVFIGDCPMALNKAVYRRMSNEFFFYKTTFVLDKGSLGETLMTSFYTWHKHV